MLQSLVQTLWRLLPGNIQWKVLRSREDKFLVGVSCLILNDQDEVLLFDHQLWPHGATWAPPTGYLHRGETPGECIARELREECGFTGDLRDLNVLQVFGGFRWRIEVLMHARVSAFSTQGIPNTEVKEARWFDAADLPDEMSTTLQTRVQEGIQLLRSTDS